MANYNKARYFKVKEDEIKHEKAKEIAERIGLLEYGTTNKDRLKMWKQKDVKYEDLSSCAKGVGECYKYGEGRNTKYYYRTPVYTNFTYTLDHYTYGIFNQEPSEKELEVLLMGGESVKYETQDVVKHVGKKLFKQVFGFNPPSLKGIKNLFTTEQEEKEEDIMVKMYNFLEDDRFRNEQAATIDEVEHNFIKKESQDIQFEYDEKLINEMKSEYNYHNLIKQMDNHQYESSDMVMKF